MHTFLKYLPLATFTASLFSGMAHADTTIAIVRHGEKPALGLGQLDCKGLNRSLALAPKLLQQYGQPLAIYAPNPAQEKEDKGVPYFYIRPLATIEPTAIRLGLPVNIKWGMTEINTLADTLAAQSGVQFVAWEHHWGEALARRLLQQTGGDPAQVPTWDDKDFDSIYVVRIKDDGKGSKIASFAHEQEGLNNLSDNCPVPAGSQ